MLSISSHQSLGVPIHGKESQDKGGTVMGESFTQQG